MVVGLGSGSTAALFVRALGERVRAGLRIVGVPTSQATEDLARAEAFVTDGGHYVLDCRFADLSDPVATGARIKALTGVVDHGLFIGLATEAIVGNADGRVRVLE